MSKSNSARRSVLIPVAIALLFAALSGVADDRSASPEKVIPQETGVLLLPALDATTDSAHMQAPRQAVIRHRVEYEFITRQFKMLGETMAAKAADNAPRIDLENLSTRTAENLDELARRAGADWVVNVVVENVHLDSTNSGQFDVGTRIRLQIRDARRRDWLFNDSYSGHANGAGSPVFVFKDSIDNATKDSLRKALNAYPATVAVSQENSLTDYLAGQTEPFVGDPATPFSGVKVNP